MPQIVILAGPNGAGKTTASKQLLRDRLGVTEFVNADAIATGLSAFDPAGVALEAGRIMLTQLRQLAADGRDFAFETTLASRTFTPWLRGLIDRDAYEVDLYFFWLPSVEMAVARVAQRVITGGHHVPEETIRRRYDRGISNFFELYRPLASRWAFHDASVRTGPILIAEGRGASMIDIHSADVWDTIRRRYDRDHPA